MVLKILNGLPLAAFEDLNGYAIIVREITEEKAKMLLKTNSNFESYIGHEGTAKILTQKLGTEIKFNRASASLTKNDTVLVCSIKLSRLPEGKILTEEEMRDTQFRYFVVWVQEWE